MDESRTAMSCIGPPPGVGQRPSPQGSIALVVLAAQPVVRLGVRQLLDGRASITLAGEAAHVADGAAIVTSVRPHVILLDPDCEDFSLQTVPQIAGLWQAPVLVFTGATDPHVHGRAVALGAMGVVEKRHSADTLGRAVEKVHAGEVWLERRATASMVQQMVQRNSDPEALKIDSLTKREREVIGLIGSGFKSEAIANRLFISQATVRNHLTSILGKLELADRFELAFYARKHGLARVKDDPSDALHRVLLRTPARADLVDHESPDRRHSNRRVNERP